jgi:ubiquitin-like 1-activating enzyme E1 B
LDDKPIKGLDISGGPESDPHVSPIPRKRKLPVESNGPVSNGINEAIPTANGSLGTKRTAEEALDHDSPDTKRSKLKSNGTNGASTNGELISAEIIEDSTDGAIVIDDD